MVRSAARAAFALALVAGAGAGLAQEQGAPPSGRGAGPGAPRRAPSLAYANPSAVIAAELAFARDARQRGQWTAFAAAAAPDAVMVVPQLVWAQQWLAGRANPPVALQWQPEQVWSSCDGTLVASHGRWQAPAEAGRPARQGWFTTLWERQPDGAYRWVLDHGDEAASLPEAPEMMSAQVADCPPRPRRPDGEGAGSPPPRPVKPASPPRPPRPKDLPALDPAQRTGAARDGSLRWELGVSPDGARRLTLRWIRDGRESLLREERVAAPPSPR